MIQLKQQQNIKQIHMEIKLILLLQEQLLIGKMIQEEFLVMHHLAFLMKNIKYIMNI